MSSERNRLKVYDELRKMHSILKSIPEREDNWEQNALDAIHAVLYLAEHVFTCGDDEGHSSLAAEVCECNPDDEQVCRDLPEARPSYCRLRATLTKVTSASPCRTQFRKENHVETKNENQNQKASSKNTRGRRAR